MRCPDCGQEWQTNYCPNCKKTFHEIVESSESIKQPSESTSIKQEGSLEPVLMTSEQSQQIQDYKFCMHCGQKLVSSAVFCWKCGIRTTAIAPPIHVSQGPGMKGTLSEASASLIVSLIGFVFYFCCIGVLLEPIALYLGIKALHVLKEDPGYSGRGLAIAGIVISGILILFTLLMLLIAATSDIRYYESF